MWSGPRQFLPPFAILQIDANDTNNIGTRRKFQLSPTFGVVTLGLLPPMAPGRMDPVSLYRARIFETQPCDTLRK